MTSLKSKKFISMLLVLAMALTLLPATVVFGASYKSVEDFVTNLYVAGLGRQPEEAGLKFWLDELEKGRPAAEVIGFVLLDSEEFNEKFADIPAKEFVKKAYEIVFAREADEEGLKFWVDKMRKGASQRYVIVAMLEAPPYEFKEFCDKVGIKAGTLPVRDEERPGEEDVDDVAPVFDYKGETKFTVEFGEEFPLPVVTATDNIDGEVDVTRVITNKAGEKIAKIDTTVPGVYTITYSAVDVAGNVNELVLTVTVKPFRVVEVSAINANEIQVTFSAPVDATSAKTTDNYVITLNNKRYGKDNANNPYNGGFASEALDDVNPVTVSKDGKVVTLKLKNTFKLDNGDKYGVDVRDGIYSADMSKRVEKYGDTQKVFQDYDAPKLLKVALNADNKLVLTFDEPIFDDSTAGYPPNEQFKVTVDGTPVAMDTPSTTPLVYTVTSRDPLPAEALEKGVHNVVVYNARDLVENNGAGGNKAAILRGSYEIKEGEAPYVKSIEAVDFNSFKITFSESVSNARVVVKKGNTEFYNDVVDPGATATIHLPVTVVSATFGLTHLYDNNAMSTNISIIVKDYKDSDDLLGNQYSQSLKLERDAKLPQALGTSQNSILATDLLQVVFNRDDIQLDATKITVLDKDGVSREIASTEIVSVGTGRNNAINIALKKGEATMGTAELNDLAPFTVEFAPGALKVDTDKVDVVSPKTTNPLVNYEIGESTNSLKNVAHSTKIAKDDDFAYKAVEAVQSVTVANNVITITYKEEMAVSATQIANYTLDGEAMPAGTKIAMDGENKVVTITLPEGTFVKNVQKKLVISDKVMTKAGSYVVGNLSTKEPYMSDLLEFKDNTKPVLKEAQFVVSDTSDTTTNTIRLTFSENVRGTAEAENFVIIAHEGTVITVTQATEADGTGKVVDLTLASHVNMSQVVKVKVVPESESGIAQALTDLAGNTLAEGTIVTVSGKVQQ